MSIWFREAGGDRRERRPRLSRERIVEAAVDLLDAEGVAGFSMRALAARLQAGTMSLYEYVKSKEDVLDLALDEVIGEIEPVEEGSWRVVLVGQLTQSREVMRRHPWLSALTGTRPLLGPNALARSRLFYSALAGAGLSGPALTAAVGALTYYVNGYVAAENTWWATVRTSEADTEIRERVVRHLNEHVPGLAPYTQVDNGDFDSNFLLGLDIILDGILARLPDRT
ncbi:TetR family transcriptional regulator [Nonomuraea phyllanthi]|uniref:TetR family transcriptional regulator n=1 Tax=Nonomuraea phyllanthi TaxID=2219224 RepID=A0A5C4W957_9ACTN|nr:TetR/AcrR family transcriptional regulator C-terminal domain-containing protein [Nonomuraea phyllanthi]KAB8192662.1 TetR family transcriptional regulator [Nonomuraea phyllanthi]QFY08138.1 TetR family transcriptional regulator [Nonomuraea phyllanthi]